jgi:penicillin G amidase
MEALQADVLSPPARELRLLLRGVEGSSDDASAQLLLRWNCVLDRDSPAAALFELWVMEIEKQVTHLVAPEQAWNLLEGHIPLTVVLNRLAHPDQTLGAGFEAARDRLLLETLRAATQKIKILQGADASQWSWGRLHTATFHHSLELVGQARALFNIGPLARPGDSYTVNNASYSDDKFDQRSGPSYREILDIGNWDESLTVNAPGQSGQPGSPHYADLVALWDQGRYFPLLYSQVAVQQRAKDQLVLEPAPQH